MTEKEKLLEIYTLKAKDEIDKLIKASDGEITKELEEIYLNNFFWNAKLEFLKSLIKDQKTEINSEFLNVSYRTTVDYTFNNEVLEKELKELLNQAKDKKAILQQDPSTEKKKNLSIIISTKKTV